MLPYEKEATRPKDGSFKSHRGGLCSKRIFVFITMNAEFGS